MHSETLAIDGGAPLRTRPFGPRWVIGEEERRQVLEVIDSADTTWRSRFKVRELAEAFAARHGVRYAIPTSSGTGAVHTAVAAIDPEPGDEIITTPVSDIGSVLGIMLHNAVPVFADWDPYFGGTGPIGYEDDTSYAGEGKTKKATQNSSSQWTFPRSTGREPTP